MHYVRTRPSPKKIRPISPHIVDKKSMPLSLLLLRYEIINVHKLCEVSCNIYYLACQLE
uniref:Uncharacterized protein n=1 Tax=Rhizophora mucronata TaxID=61149 RepID=A0A2P2PAE8_RHIMU